jgi:hypothetical protein
MKSDFEKKYKSCRAACHLLSWVDVIGRKRNMEGIKKVQYLAEAYNHNCASDGIKWQFNDNLNGPAGPGKNVHFTPT